jgi:uncharacterized damage-inducible protein DinB
LNVFCTSKYTIFAANLKTDKMTNKEFFINQWNSEMKATINCIKAVPNEKSTYTPNPKSRTAGAIVSHVVPQVNDIIEACEKGTMGTHSDMTFSTMEEAAMYYETKSKEMMEMVAKVDETTWMTKVIPLSVQGNKVYEAPMYAMCWTLLNDTIHHRGQLSTYYRPMGVKNPSIYGPTAEMMEEMMMNATTMN